MRRPRARAAARISIGLLCLTLSAPLGCGAQDGGEWGASASEADSAQPTRPAPSFALQSPTGDRVALADQRGKPVVIDFWATWCAPCVYQVPELNAFWKKHRDAADVAVIGVAVDSDGASVVAPWIAQQGVEYPIALGDEALAREFGVMGFPTLAIIDADGNIVSLHVGVTEVEELEELLAPYIASAKAHQPAS